MLVREEGGCWKELYSAKDDKDNADLELP